MEINTLYLVAFVALIVIVFIIITYNRIIYSYNAVQNAFSSVDIILKKRYDLIPNLVETAKAYAKYESELFSKITELRDIAIRNSVSRSRREVDLIKINDELTAKLARLYAVVENYPQIKADKLFLNLSKSLAEVENELSAGRRAYNAAVVCYNNLIMTFPINIISKILGRERINYFQVDYDFERETEKLFK